MGPRGLDGLKRAAATYGTHFTGATEKNSFNIFTQNAWYVGKLAGGAPLPSLRRLIDNGSDTVIVSDKKDADALLDVLAEDRVKTISSLTPQGVVREYRITYRFRFQLRDAKDNLLIPPSEITQFRDLSYNDADTLSKESEEALLFRDMQSDAVAQLLRHLQTPQQKTAL